MSDHLTLGVEEEFHVADAASRMLTDESDVLLSSLQRDGFGSQQFASEIYLSMVETASVVCTTLDEVRDQLRALRQELCATAGERGMRILAAGTMPLARGRLQRITPNERYREIEQMHQQVSREMMACGMHVHVGMPDREEAVQVLNHARPYLAPLLALSANSPFWDEHDTGFASYRSILWGRWPSAAMPQLFSGVEEYDAVGRMLEDRLFDPLTRSLLAPAMLFEQLFAELHDALDAEGDTEQVTELLDKVLCDGSAAKRQRAAFAASGRLQDTVDLIADATCA